MASPSVHEAAALRRATRGVCFVFIGAGLAAASWAARIPQVREELGLAIGLLVVGATRPIADD